MGLYDQTNSAQDALAKLRRATASASAAQKIAMRDYEQAQAEADKWERRYQLAVKEGCEDMARKAEFQKERYKATATRLKALVDQQKPQLDTLKCNLASWESKVSEAENEALVSRHNTSNATSAFERMEEKDLQIKAGAKAVLQQDNANEGSKFSTFVNFEDIDGELARIKAELLSTRPQHQAEDAFIPEEIIEKAIREMREAVTKAVASSERIQKQHDEAREEANDCHKKAQLALQKDDENLAFKALITKSIQGKVATAFKTQLAQQEATVKLLKRNLVALEKVKNMLEIEAELVKMKAQMLDSTTSNVITQDRALNNSSSTSSNITFSIEVVQQLRQCAQEACEVPNEGSEGWTKSDVNPMQLLASFPLLKLKEGLVLRAYQCRMGSDGKGIVWAMPEQLAFPEPEACLTLKEELLKPPQPPGALSNLMEAIEGDYSPLSYLSASLFAREVAEFGAMWHCCNWGLHQIIGSDPWIYPQSSTQRSSFEGLTGIPDEWQWSEPKPSVWSPQVCINSNVVTVTFHTFCGRFSETIRRHRDTYKLGQYCFEYDWNVIANGPMGYMI